MRTFNVCRCDQSVQSVQSVLSVQSVRSTQQCAPGMSVSAIQNVTIELVSKGAVFKSLCHAVSPCPSSLKKAAVCASRDTSSAPASGEQSVSPHRNRSRHTVCCDLSSAVVSQTQFCSWHASTSAAKAMPRVIIFLEKVLRNSRKMMLSGAVRRQNLAARQDSTCLRERGGHLIQHDRVNPKEICCHTAKPWAQGKVAYDSCLDP